MCKRIENRCSHQLGFLERTPRGRLATQLAYQYLGLPYNKEKPPQPTLL